MSLFDHYVCNEIYRLQRETLPPDVQHRIQWLQWQEERRIARRRALARWLGDRLVGTGERLHAWAAAGTPAQPAATNGVPRSGSSNY